MHILGHVRDVSIFPSTSTTFTSTPYTTSTPFVHGEYFTQR